MDWQIRWSRGIMLTRVFMNLATCNFCQICQLLTICDLWHGGHSATLYLWALYTFYCVIRQWVPRNMRNNWPEFSIKILYSLTSAFRDWFFLNKTCWLPSTAVSKSQSWWRQLLYDVLPGLVTRHACHVDSCHASGSHVTRVTKPVRVYFWDLNNNIQCCRTHTLQIGVGTYKR